jgi:hypothetical protein
MTDEADEKLREMIVRIEMRLEYIDMLLKFHTEAVDKIIEILTLMVKKCQKDT